MIHDRNFAEKYAASNLDMILEFYRKIGISAVAAALEAASRKPQGPMPCDASGRNHGVTDKNSQRSPFGYRRSAPSLLET
jgi:hypothetical protein